MKKILIADDHNIIRVGVKGLLQENFSPVQIDEASCGIEIEQLIKAGDYNLILLDINIPDTDFIKLMNWLKVYTPVTAVLIFSVHAETIYGKRCMQLGASGYLNKKASNNEIISAVTKVLKGGKYISPEMEAVLCQPKDTENPFSKLSARELEIAMLIKTDHSLPQISDILNINYSTANTYKRRLFEKLNVQTPLALIKLMEAFKIEA